MTRYETPVFDPGIAFSWTLRSEEIARRQRQRSRKYAYSLPFVSSVPTRTTVGRRLPVLLVSSPL